MATNVVVLLQSENGRRLVRRKCAEAGLEISVLERLVRVELAHMGKKRKHGITQDFDEVFSELDEEY